jgi:hypothetical protein
MPKWSETIERHRPSLLAVIMGALLLLSVALAGLLIALRGGAKQEGTDVLLVLRQKKLPAFWSNDGVNQWFLWTGPDGRPAGWSTRTRGLAPKGYQGKKLEWKGSVVIQEAWQVDRAGTTGRYLGRAWAVIRRPGVRIPLLQPVSTTSILLRDGQVQVRHSGLRGGQSGQAVAPANYIPEGLTELAYYLASLGDQRVTFAWLNDESAVAGGRLNFSRVTATPEGKNKVLLSLQLPEGAREERMEFDAKGEVLRGSIPSSGFSYERSTFDLVKKAFPDVELFLKREAEEAPED